jgi:hypothetical protein
LIERAVSSEVQKTYEELRSILLENNCRIIVEEPLKSIIVEHGSPSVCRHETRGKASTFFPTLREPGSSAPHQ